MRSWIAATAAAAVLALTGCTANPPSRAYLALSAGEDEKAELARYRAELDDADIAPLHGKINFLETYYRGEPACQHLRADADRRPTPAEAESLRRWAKMRTAYFERFHALELKTGAASDKVAPLTQRYVDALEEDLRRTTALIAELADGKMTYCEFATRHKEAVLGSYDRALPLRKEMVAAMTEEHYFEGTGLSGGIDNSPAFYLLGMNNGNGMGGGRSHAK